MEHDKIRVSREVQFSDSILRCISCGRSVRENAAHYADEMILCSRCFRAAEGN